MVQSGSDHRKGDLRHLQIYKPGTLALTSFLIHYRLALPFCGSNDGQWWRKISRRTRI